MQAEAEGFRVEDLSPGRLVAIRRPGPVPRRTPDPSETALDRRQGQGGGVEIIGDIELFARAMDRTPGSVRPKVIAITGTNGKSTTTALIGWVLKQAGLKVASAATSASACSPCRRRPR
jgi:UDP-N-acetylmuramoylalanine--D-glutamate ligase